MWPPLRRREELLYGRQVWTGLILMDSLALMNSSAPPVQQPHLARGADLDVRAVVALEPTHKGCGQARRGVGKCNGR